MTKKRLPKSIRKFIRREKARIRREVFGLEKQKKVLEELYQKLNPKKKKSDDKTIEILERKIPKSKISVKKKRKSPIAISRSAGVGPTPDPKESR
jgi:hypothetical protein